jgi:hypothetical protein
MQIYGLRYLPGYTLNGRYRMYDLIYPWRSQSRGPTYYRLGRHVVYDRADLDAYLGARRVEPEEAPR